LSNTCGGEPELGGVIRVNEKFIAKGNGSVREKAGIPQSGKKANWLIAFVVRREKTSLCIILGRQGGYWGPPVGRGGVEREGKPEKGSASWELKIVT